MKKFIYKGFIVFLSLFMTLSFVSVNGTKLNAAGADDLINIAELCDVTVPQNESAIPNMFDGNTHCRLASNCYF